MKKYWIVVFLSIVLSMAGKAEQIDRRIMVELPADSLTSLSLMAQCISHRYHKPDTRLWGLYSWVATHIRYDMSARDQQMRMPKEDDLALWTLQNRRGVCANFAQLFAAVARRMHIETYAVSGYIVTFDNIRDDGHEWCACIIDGNPYIFDPTWGGGYMLNNQQYVSRLDDQFFMVAPEKMILTHVPEDPLFQFLNYPKYYDEIDNPGKDRPVPVYRSWRDSLWAYNRQDSIARLEGELRRMRDNGFANDWIQQEIKRVQYNYQVCLYNKQNDRMNGLVTRLNFLVNYFNNGYKPHRSRQWLNTEIAKIRGEIPDITEKLEIVNSISDTMSVGVDQMIKGLNSASDQLDLMQKSIEQNYNRYNQ